MSPAFEQNAACFVTFSKKAKRALKAASVFDTIKISIKKEKRKAKKMKKLVSLLLALTVVLTLFVPAFAAEEGDECDCGYTPIIDIKGTTIYKDTENLEAGKAEKEVSGGKDAVIETSLNISKAFAKAMLTDKWDDYCDVLYEEIMPVYDQYALNNDGEIGNKSGIDPNYNIENVTKRAIEGGRERHIREKDNILMYEYLYDSRLDPIQNAALLKRFVETVKEVTGHKKVNILGRCAVCVILNTYFLSYGWDDVESVIFYNSIACGAEVADACFSGEIFLDSTSLNRKAYEFLGLSLVLDLMMSVVEASEYAGLLEKGTDFIQKIYNKVAPNIMPRLLRDIFGTCPGWYSYISPEYYEKCKSFILGDNADGKYDKLIEKIDNYNYNFKPKARSVLEDMAEGGVKVYVVAKYNSQMYPMLKNSEILGDDTISVYKQTYNGATCADISKTLSDEYIATADRRFVSPDKMIDSSTGVLPEHTWYMRDLAHMDYPLSLDPYMLRLMRSESYASVDTFEDMPQYMRYVKSEDKFVPMNEENAPSADEGRPSNDPVRILINFIKRFFALIGYYIKNLFQK